MSNIAYIIDGTNILTRYWMATGGNGNPLTGFMNMLNAFAAKHKPEKVAAVFDGGGETFRHRVYPDYKAHRTERDPGLTRCLASAVESCRQGSRVYQVPGVEADDIIGSLTRMHVETGSCVVIQSSDKDMYQLLADGAVTILQQVRRVDGKWTCDYFTAAMFRTRYGFDPWQWPDYRALAGDASDNWPGAEGVGEKTAQELIVAFRTLEGVKASIRDWPHSLELKRAKIELNKTAAAGIRKLNVPLARSITRLNTAIYLEEAVA